MLISVEYHYSNNGWNLVIIFNNSKELQPILKHSPAYNSYPVID